MKRTVEIVLSVLGVITSLVMVGTGVVFLYLKNNEAFLQYLDSGWTASQNAYTLEQLGQAGTMFILPGIIGVVLGVCAVMMLKGNRSPKLAGWGLIIISVIISIVSVIGMIPALFFIIAGIMALVRKAKG
ncbi:DUF4064 domain-containing protein [Shouchella clausii]|jgi:hypothetical protein|uniref:DUF4064 domain-containing protein n=1 Tax=Shouchella clausii TaxID=79880 RepID=UPI000793338D|nr:DUF4064 domain-containing protein [Shouchella clausii]PAD40765.1 DUF4064 domain-containing protein [Bacillus sp. 7520-S]KKI86772.1 hypothetical protein WZ76_08750 [Shouchella clausii]MBU8598768.1 DUF4064 domain-containing protein [Shouchella clausii]MCY1106810.1 DUF4064 domain-containing protein [Shouchella clausii]MEB5480696.1 DUF4064 domain-containing protein [Shouchella clausii]